VSRETGWDGGSPKRPGSRTLGRRCAGVLAAFIVVEDGNLEIAHVVKRRRRTRIASKLVAYAMENHGLTSAHGQRTYDGAALLGTLSFDH